MLCGSVSAHAQIIITEVMYDVAGSDAKSEWIEIYNQTINDIDLADWRFVEGGARHTFKRDEGTILPGKTYAIVADDAHMFNTLYPLFRGIVFDSSFSLNNTGELLELENNTDVVDSIQYTSEHGALGDGNTLHRDGQVFVAGAPSPGVGGVVHDAVDTSATTTAVQKKSTQASKDGSVSGHSSPTPVSNKTHVSEFNLVVPRNRLTTSGTFLTFEVVADDGGSVSNIVWSFGDATIEYGQRVKHGYHFAGEYIVVVEARRNSQVSVARFIVSVFDPEIYFGAITNEYIELYNMSEYEVNLEGWKLGTEGKQFVFPKDTIIAPNRLIKFERGILGDMQAGVLELYTPMGKTHRTSVL